MTAFAFALGSIESHGQLASAGWFHGLLLGLTAAAAAVIAQAVVALARVLCPDGFTRTVAIVTAAGSVATALRFAPASWAWIAVAALAGALFGARPGVAIAAASLPIRVPRAVAALAAGIVGVLVIALVVQPFSSDPRLAVFATIARAGTLVFGGGHVVLPLLQSLTTNGLVQSNTFFAGYGLVQAMPGPLFTFGTFLGAANTSALNGVAGALFATIAIFAPSFALVFATAPVWDAVRELPRAAAALRGANAGVVGLLAGVLIHPVLTTVATSWPAMVIAVAAYLVITLRHVAPWLVVAAAAICGALAGSQM
jgi:chromate transporter